MTDHRLTQTEQSLQAGLIQLLQTHSFETITIRHLCQFTQISRSTFYRHYPDKQTLFAQIVTQQEDYFDQILANRIQNQRQIELLIDLYQGLVTYRATILVLFQLSIDKLDLKQAYLKRLKQYLVGLLPSLQTPVTNDFLIELYATNILLALQWTLAHDDIDNIAQFMKRLTLDTLQRYRETQ